MRKLIFPGLYTVLLRIDKFSKPLEIESYCSCKSGARTIGGCCHSSAILSRITLEKYGGDLEERKLKKKKKFEIIKDFKKQKKL